jgi:inorganic pyrophosphatase
MSIKQDLNKARKNTDKTPSEAQKKSGNYKKGHININGFRISLENPKGSYRKGVDSNGREWKTKMKNDYGYFLNTLGYDNDHIDVFLGNKIDSKKIFVIDQRINGKFDESKVMLWFNTENEAKKAYLSNYEKNWKGFYKITEVDEELFKTWLYDGKKQRKPFYQYKAIKEYNKKMNIKENFIKKVIKEAIARVSIHEANENTLLTNKLIKVLYKIASKYTSKIYTDDAWEGVHALMNNLRSVNGVESLDYGGGRYHSISKNIGEGTYKAYNIKIMTAFNTTISGELRCHFSGTNDDPWSKYDMSISLWRQNEEPNMFESKNGITESYEPIGGGYEFIDENGIERISVVTIQSQSGQMCHIAEDDHCYLLFNDYGSGKNCTHIKWIFPEALKALQMLPLP